MNDDPSEDHRVLWTHAAEELRFFKLQQYSVTNYAVALYAALFAIAAQLKPAAGIRVFLMLGVIGVAAACLTQLQALQASIRRQRDYLETARQRLSPELTQTIGRVRAAHPNRGQQDATPILHAVVIGGGIAAVILILA